MTLQVCPAWPAVCEQESGRSTRVAEWPGPQPLTTNPVAALDLLHTLDFGTGYHLGKGVHCQNRV